MQAIILTGAVVAVAVVARISYKWGYNTGHFHATTAAYDLGKKDTAEALAKDFKKERVAIAKENFDRGQITGEAIGYEKGFAAGKVDPRDPKTGKYVPRKSKK